MTSSCILSYLKTFPKVTSYRRCIIDRKDQFEKNGWKLESPVSLTGATQGCSGCGEAGHNITTCWFREANVDEALDVS